MAFPLEDSDGAVEAALGGAEAVLLLGRGLVGKIERLEEIVRRQDEAIDSALEVFARLAKRGSVTRDSRDAAMRLLVEARNERIPMDDDPTIDPVETWVCRCLTARGFQFNREREHSMVVSACQDCGMLRSEASLG